MRLNALILCQDAQSSEVLSSVLDEFDIGQKTCRSEHQAMETLLEGEPSAVIIDFDTAGAVALAKMVRLLVPQSRPAIVAVIGRKDSGGQAAQIGANVTLYKPLESDDIRNAMGTARKLIQMDQRRSVRHKMKALVYLEPETATIPAIGMDVSEHGIAIRAAEPVPMVSGLPFRFVLPGTGHAVQGEGDVIWADQKGRAGMFFTRITPASRKHLKNWLVKRGPANKDAVRALLSPTDERHAAPVLG